MVYYWAATAEMSKMNASVRRLLLLNNTPRPEATLPVLDDLMGQGWTSDQFWGGGGEFPTDVSAYSGVVISGSPAAAYDEVGWVAAEHVLIQRMAQQRVPMLGICFGSQILASALCGRDQVFRRKWCEVGHLPLTLKPEAAEDPLFYGMPPRPEMFVWHNDEVRSDHHDMMVLAVTDDCPNQIWRHRALPVWGVQGHLELRPADAPVWFERNRTSLEKDGADVTALLQGVHGNALWENVFRRFLDFCVHGASVLGPSLVPAAAARTDYSRV